MIKILTVLYEFCFRLNFTKDPTTNTIAGATLRQLTPVVMERVSICDEQVRFDHLGFWLNKYYRICNSQLLFLQFEKFVYLTFKTLILKYFQTCKLCLQHCYEEPSQTFANLTRGIFTRYS